MKALLAALTVALCAAISLTLPGGAAAVLLCAACAVFAAVLLSRAGGDQRGYLLKVFVGGLLIRAAVGTLINAFHLQEFFGGDALTYDFFGKALLDSWRSGLPIRDAR